MKSARQEGSRLASLIIQKFRTPTYFIFTNLLCAVGQLILISMFALMEGFLGLFFGNYFWDIDTAHHIGRHLPSVIIFACLLGVTFGAVWLLIWWVMYGSAERIQWFYWKLTSATLPLIIPFLVFSPKPNPTAMIPPSHAEFQFVFGCMATGLVAFPIYSIGLYKLVFQAAADKLIRFVGVSVSVAIIGSGMFIAAWNLLDPIYHLG